VNTATQAQTGYGGNALAVFAMATLLLIVLWFGAHDAVARGFVLLLWGEAWVVKLVLTPLTSPDTLAELKAWRKVLILAYDQPAAITLTKLGEFLAYGGLWIRWPAAGLCLVLGVWPLLGDRTLRLTRRFTFERLIRENAKVWPRMRPVAEASHLLEEGPDQGDRAWAKTPLSFALEHGCLRNRLGTTLRETTAEEPMVFHADSARGAFEAQLGPLWQGFEQLGYHEQVLFAAITGRLIQRKQEADALLDRVASTFRTHKDGTYSFDAGDLEIELAQAALDHAEVKKVIRDHAHVRNVLAVLLERARQTAGVLACSDFIWLKPVDRALWYALNQVGRRVAWPEASGLRAQLRFEIRAKRALKEPHVEYAVVGLKDALYDEGWIDEPAVF
jgi:intracellular multiplication protein IcmP